MQFNVLRESENFSNSSLHRIFEPENFRTVSFLLRKIAKPGDWNVKNKTSENRRKFIR